MDIFQREREVFQFATAGEQEHITCTFTVLMTCISTLMGDKLLIMAGSVDLMDIFRHAREVFQPVTAG